MGLKTRSDYIMVDVIGNRSGVEVAAYWRKEGREDVLKVTLAKREEARPMRKQINGKSAP